MKFIKGFFFFWLLPAFVIIGIPTLLVGNNLLIPSSWSIDFTQIKNLLVSSQSIFLAIIIESFPFVLVGALLSSLIHELISEEWLVKRIPKNKIMAILFAGLIGFVLPVCDCGTMPVARSLLQKGVPRSAVIAFTLSAPVVNPVTFIATYFAFGMNVRIAAIRVIAAYTIACMVGLIVGNKRGFEIIGKIKSNLEIAAAVEDGLTGKRFRKIERFGSIMDHVEQELFGIIGFLICSAAVASIYQVYHTQHFAFGQMHTGVTSIISLMGLAILFSLCSQADAFVARTFVSSYSPGAVLAFMLIGQMTDIRNLLLLPKTFGGGVTLRLVLLCAAFCLAAGVLSH